MRYLIDGHNLIPHVAGLSLRALDDEEALITRLQTYAQRTRSHLEVFFDGAPPLQQRTQSRGRVKVHFVSRHSTADDAIVRRLHSMGKNARNWIVVTSDREVQANARACGAGVLPAQDFAPQLSAPVDDPPQPEKPAPPQTPDEVEYWLRIFHSTADDE